MSANEGFELLRKYSHLSESSRRKLQPLDPDG
jgi:hypothetical protein